MARASLVAARAALAWRRCLVRRAGQSCPPTATLLAHRRSPTHPSRGVRGHAGSLGRTEAASAGMNARFYTQSLAALRQPPAQIRRPARDRSLRGPPCARQAWRCDLTQRRRSRALTTPGMTPGVGPSRGGPQGPNRETPEAAAVAAAAAAAAAAARAERTRLSRAPRSDASGAAGGRRGAHRGGAARATAGANAAPATGGGASRASVASTTAGALRHTSHTAHNRSRSTAAGSPLLPSNPATPLARRSSLQTAAPARPQWLASTAARVPAPPLAATAPAVFAATAPAVSAAPPPGGAPVLGHADGSPTC